MLVVAFWSTGSCAPALLHWQLCSSVREMSQPSNAEIMVEVQALMLKVDAMMELMQDVKRTLNSGGLFLQSINILHCVEISF